MTKKSFLISLGVLVLIVAGLSYWQSTLPSTNPNEHTNPDPAGEDTTENWVTYTNPEIGIGIQHPDYADIQVHDSGGDDLVVISHAGPTQTEGTEFYDGFSVGVTAHNYTTTTDLEAIAQAELDANAEVGQVVEGVAPVTVAGISGFRFIFSGLGTSTSYYLAKNNQEYIVVHYFAEDPGNLGFEQTATRILESLKILDQ